MAQFLLNNLKKDSFILHSSRVALPDNFSSRHLLDLTNLDLKIDKTMLLKLEDGDSDNDERMETYRSLIGVYMNYAKLWKLSHTKRGRTGMRTMSDFFVFDVKLISIAKYISKHVLEYLYVTNEYE